MNEEKSPVMSCANGTVFLVVRSVVDPNHREEFALWYSRHHLPDAVRHLGAQNAYRFNGGDPGSDHIAVYQFPPNIRTVDDAESLMRELPETLRREYDQKWENRATRTREFVVMTEAIPGRRA